MSAVPASSTFTRKALEVTIILGTGDFGAGPPSGGPIIYNTLTAQGLRCSCQITKQQQPSADRAEIRIWGLRLKDMNAATRLGPIPLVRNNVVQISAGDAVNGMSEVFSGTMITSYGDFNDPPNAVLTITAISNLFDSARPVAPSSFPAGADVVTVFTQIARLMNKNLINWGVSGLTLQSPYIPGTGIKQMQRAADMFGIHATTSDGNPVEIWPWTGQRGEGKGPTIGPDSGLVGYPEYSAYGVAVRALYQPGLQWGGQFQLKTSITPANGAWYIVGLEYDLESEMIENGQWFMSIAASQTPIQ